MDGKNTENSVSDSGTSGEMSSATLDSKALLELNTVFAALGHPRQRYLLYTLANGQREQTLTELAVQIAAWEQGEPASDVSDDKRKQLEISLYHSHVPKLVDLGIVEYQEDENIIVRALNAEQVQAVLNHAGGTLDSQQEDHAREDNEG